MKKRIQSFLIAICLIFCFVSYMPVTTVYASNTANELVSVAKGELGNGYSKYTRYVGSINGRFDYAWCAAFVSWCGNQAGVSCIEKTASCYSQYQYMLSHGGYEVTTPQAGDVVFFYCNNCSGTANKWCHIGIMVDANTSIDGNYNNSVAYDRSYSHYGSLGYKHSSGIIKKYVRPNYGQTPAILPGTLDTSWNVPANVTAGRRISTYDQYGNVESNHYIDPGDYCYIFEVYTNGFVKIQYPVSGGKRWAYAKASEFALEKKEQGPGKTNVRCNVGTGYAATIFSWDKASNATCYDLKIWKDKIWQGDAYQILWNLSGTSAQVCLPPGYYEAYVDSRNGQLINMSNNVVKFTVSDGVSVNLDNDFYATIITNKNQLALTNTNGNVDVRRQDGSAKQVWHFKRQSDGSYIIQNTADNKYLDTDNSRDANGTNIKTWTYNGSDAQKYYIYRHQSGAYLLKPKCAVRFVDVCGGKNNPGDNVQLWDFNAGDAQQLAIVKTTNPIEAECTHKFGSWTIVNKATCTADGSEKRTCSLCGKIETRIIKATGHRYTDKAIAPTATQKGYTIHTCLNCGDSYKDNYTDVKKQLQSITITSLPFTKFYFQNGKLDTEGMKVVATYTDGSQREVSGWKATADTAKIGQIPVTVTYSEGGQTAKTTFSIQVGESPEKTAAITYNPMGGTFSQTKQTVTKFQPIKLFTEEPQKSVLVSFDAYGGGYTPAGVELQQNFIDWSYNINSVTKKFKSGATVYVSEDCYLTANYEPVQISLLPTVQRQGYTFLGWYLPNGQRVSGDTLISENCTLTAKWQEKTKENLIAIDSEDDTFVEEIMTDHPVTDDVEYHAEDDWIHDVNEKSEVETIPIGEEIKTNTGIFIVTKIGDYPCVEYTKLLDDDDTDVVIPESITISGVTYKVTSIASKAFYKNRLLKKVTITSSVTKIESKAFYGCASLKNIWISSSKLKSTSIGTDAFTKVAKNVNLHVPSEKYKTYKKILKKAGIGSKAKLYKVML